MRWKAICISKHRVSDNVRQGDIIRNNEIQRDIDTRGSSFNDVYNSELSLARDRRNVSVRTRNTPYIIPKFPLKVGAVFSPLLDTPTLLVPANPNRISLKIAGVMIHHPHNVGLYVAYRVFYSFGYPVKSFQKINLPIGSYYSYGLPMPGYELDNNATFVGQPALSIVAPSNGVISVDDVYVTVAAIGNLQTAEDTVSICAYEGVLAVSANEIAA